MTTQYLLPKARTCQLNSANVVIDILMTSIQHTSTKKLEFGESTMHYPIHYLQHWYDCYMSRTEEKERTHIKSRWIKEYLSFRRPRPLTHLPRWSQNRQSNRSQCKCRSFFSFNIKDLWISRDVVKLKKKMITFFDSQCRPERHIRLKRHINYFQVNYTYHPFCLQQQLYISIFDQTKRLTLPFFCQTGKGASLQKIIAHCPIR